VRLRIDDVFAGGRVRDRATVIQKKTGRPVQFESPSKRAALSTSGWPPWVPAKTDTCSRAVSGSSRTSRHASTRGSSIDGLSGPGLIVRRTARTRCAERSRAQIYRKTGNLRAVQLLLGHTKLESTVRYLGIEVDDAISILEQVEL
jgi:hypothetical protein